MVNDSLVMELMKLYAAHPENFPRILSAIIRREMLRGVKFADEQIVLIEGETHKDSRGRYLGEHLKDLVKNVSTLSEFLEYFRDIPLGRNSDGDITTGEDVRIWLEEIMSSAMSVADNCYRKDWKMVPDEEFTMVKTNALEAAKDTREDLDELDRGLALGWTDSSIEQSAESASVEANYECIFNQENLS